MNILMVSNEFPPNVGGLQTHVYELSRALVQLGHRVKVVCRRDNDSLPATEMLAGIAVERLALPNNHLLYDWKLARHLRGLVNTEGFEISHVHGMRPLNASYKLPVPTVFTNHTSSFVRRANGSAKLRNKMCEQLAQAATVLTPSEILAEKTRAVGYQGPITFLANGVDNKMFSPGPSSLRDSLGIPEDAFVIAIACRLVPVKGVRFLAQAVAAIDDPRLHLVVAGDGAERADIEQILTSMRNNGRAHMLGAVENGEMPNIYRGANASALPSLMEATSIAGLEAMACGLPLIGSRVGGIPHIVDDGVTGFLVTPESVDELKAAIEGMLANPEHCQAMGRAASARVAECFTWNHLAGQVLAQYQAALDKYKK